MKHVELDWLSKDGLKLYGQTWAPEGEPEAVICLVHGMGEHSGRYGHVAEFMVGKNYPIMTFDLRGHGRSEGQRGYTPSFDAYMDDIDALIEHTGERYPGIPQFLYGHSLGGVLVLNYPLRRESDLVGVITSGAALRSEVADQTLKVALSKVLGSIYPTMSLASGLDANMLSRDPQVVDAYVKDPLVHDRATTGFAKHSLVAIDWVLAHASEFPLPLLLLHGTDDAICFPRGSEKIAKLVPDRCTLKLWPGLYHEIHNEPEKDQVLEFIAGWIDDILSSEV